MPARKRPKTAPRSTPKPRRSAFRLSAPAGTLPASERTFAIAAWIACGGFAAVALGFILGPHRLGDYMTETDFYGAYAQGARLIQRGVLDPSRFGVIGPGYEVALGLFGFVVRDLFLAAELLSLAASIGTLVMWFTLVRRRLNAMTACFAVLFIATNAHFLRFAYSATTDAFSIALQAGALFLLLGAPMRERGETDAAPATAANPHEAADAPNAGTANRAAVAARTHPTNARLVAAGVLAAFAFLTRYNAISLVPAGLLAILAGATAAPRRARAAALFAAGFLAPVVPWVLYSLAHGGSMSLQLHHNIAYEVFARSRGIPWDEYQKTLQPQFHNLWDVIARDPGAVAGRMLFNLGDHVRLDAVNLLTPLVALAVIAGIALGARDGALRKLWPAWLAGALLFLTLVPVFYSERYALALLPMYAALAGIAFASPRLAIPIGRAWLKPFLAVVPLAAATFASVVAQARMVDQLPTEVLTAARTLRQLARPGDRVIARKSHIAYHAGVEPLPFPFADSLDQLARYARDNHARWIYFSWPEAETRPKLWFLLDTSAVVPGLTPRVVTRPHPAVLYEIGPGFGQRPAWFSSDTLRAYHSQRAHLSVDSNNPDMLYRFATVTRALGKFSEAHDALAQLLRLQPRNTDALALEGEMMLTLNQPGRAESVFDELLAIDPQNYMGSLGRGWSLVMQGRDQEAARAWGPLIETTTDYNSLARMVMLFANLGDRNAEARARAQLARLPGAP